MSLSQRGSSGFRAAAVRVSEYVDDVTTPTEAISRSLAPSLVSPSPVATQPVETVKLCAADRTTVRKALDGPNEIASLGVERRARDRDGDDETRSDPEDIINCAGVSLPVGVSPGHDPAQRN